MIAHEHTSLRNFVSTGGPIARIILKRYMGVCRRAVVKYLKITIQLKLFLQSYSGHVETQ